LQVLEGIEAHHEPWCEAVQELGCLRHAGIVPDAGIFFKLRRLYGDSALYSEADLWVSVGNKESWLVEPLRQLFPRAKFSWLVRDGRKVCLSYLHKLGDEMYTPRGVRLLSDYLVDSSMMRPPPLEKQYWWPLPVLPPYMDSFLGWDRWRRICWYFNEVSRTLLDADVRFFHLEDLTAELWNFMDFLGAISVPLQSEMYYYRDAWAVLRRPHNVHEPVNYQMTREQDAVYWEVCGEVHELLGYGWGPLDEVKYEDG
jgi:hypothetical protein